MALQPIKHKEPASGRKANNTVAMRSAGERLLPAVNAMDLSISFMDMEEVIGFEALYDSMHKCKKGVIWKGLEFNPKKTKVFCITDGFTFLGFKYRLTDTGKVIMIIDPKNVKERCRILRRLVRKAKRGELTKAKVDECYYAWRNHASKGNSFKLLQRMDKYYKSLWR